VALEDDLGSVLLGLGLAREGKHVLRLAIRDLVDLPGVSALRMGRTGETMGRTGGMMARTGGMMARRFFCFRFFWRGQGNDGDKGTS
jgi:hypothetical protein